MEVEKSKKLIVGSEGGALEVKVEMNLDIIRVVGSFRYLGRRLVRDGASRDDLKMRVRKELKTFSKIKNMLNVRNVCLLSADRNGAAL